ncbi:hypothetical protein OHF13_27370, partial [Escherichia coli]|uniref:hypothetical protein n=1 Tax=Escherichia coli TaxID=562 RepID=UPI0021E73941
GGGGLKIKKFNHRGKQKHYWFKKKKKKPNFKKKPPPPQGGKKNILKKFKNHKAIYVKILRPPPPC